MTTTECLASKLPMVVINPIPGQEEENAQFLESKGVCVWLKKDDDPYFVFNDLLSDFAKLNEMKLNSASLGRPNSTKSICDILLN